MSIRYISTLFIFFSLFFCNTPTYSQEVQWAISDGGHSGDSSRDLYVVEDGVIFYTTVGLEKIDKNGALIWRFDFFDLDEFRYSTGKPALGVVTADTLGNTYAQLTFPTNEAGTSTINNIDIPHGDSIIKIDSNGRLLWAKKIEGARCTRVKYHNDFIYVIGMFNESVNIDDVFIFDKTENTECSFSDSYYEDDIFIAKFNTIGQVKKAIKYGGPGDDELKAVTLDNDGNIYMATNYGFSSCITDETQIHRINSDLTKVWSKTISKQYVEGNGEAVLLPSDIHIGQNGKLYIWTYTFDTVVSDNFRFINTEFAFAAGLLEYNSEGVFLNYRAFDGFPFYGQNGYFSDYKGHLLLATSFTGTKTFDNGDLTTVNSGTEPVLIKVNLNDLEMDYLVHLTGTPQQHHTNVQDWSGPIKIDNNHLYYSGSFSSGELNVSPEITLINNSGNNDKDYFLIKYDIGNLDFTISDEDTDQDSVPNRLDHCPNSPIGESVDEKGCSAAQQDSDQDGITDNLDQCPNSRLNIEVDSNGCSNEQIDTDQDGVADYLDECADTPSGVLVNSEGCEIAVLNSNLIEVEAISEICPGAGNGSIVLRTGDARQYRAILDSSVEISFINEGSFDNLSPGTYEVCISVEGMASEIICYTLSVKSASEVSLTGKVDLVAQNLKLELFGSTIYKVTINDQSFETNESNLELMLKKGINRVWVEGNVPCQGVASYMVRLGNDIQITPNPFNDRIEIHQKEGFGKTTVSIYAQNGQEVSRKNFSENSELIIDNLQSLPKGIYFLECINGTYVNYKKIIKR